MPGKIGTFGWRSTCYFMLLQDISRQWGTIRIKIIKYPLPASIVAVLWVPAETCFTPCEMPTSKSPLAGWKRFNMVRNIANTCSWPPFHPLSIISNLNPQAFTWLNKSLLYWHVKVPELSKCSSFNTTHQSLPPSQPPWRRIWPQNPRADGARAIGRSSASFCSAPMRSSSACSWEDTHRWKAGKIWNEDEWRWMKMDEDDGVERCGKMWKGWSCWMDWMVYGSCAVEAVLHQVCQRFFGIWVAFLEMILGLACLSFGLGAFIINYWFGDVSWIFT